MMLIDKLRNYIFELEEEERIENEREKDESEIVDDFIRSIVRTSPPFLTYWNKRSLIIKEINNSEFLVYSAFPRYKGHFIQGIEAIVIFHNGEEYTLQTKLRKFEKWAYISFAVIIVLGNVAAFAADNFFPMMFLFFIPTGWIQVLYQKKKFKRIVRDFLIDLA